MATDKKANTSLYLTPDIKAALRLRYAKYNISITKQIQDAIDLYLRTMKD